MNRSRTDLRRQLFLLSATGAALVCSLALGYTNPPSDSSDNADVVFVLGLATPERLALAREISSSRGGVPIYVSEPHMRRWVCEKPDLICVVPHPATTKGEAELLAAVVANESFNHPAVLTFGPHLIRARYIFHRCFGVSADFVRVDELIGPVNLLYQLGYQTLGMAKAIATPCATEGADALYCRNAQSSTEISHPICLGGLVSPVVKAPDCAVPTRRSSSRRWWHL